MKSAQVQASVQRDLLSLRETSGDMLCFYAPGSPTRRSYRAVLEVAPINLSLKGEDEQEAIIERFGALIRSLSYPLQILVRNQRLDLSPYIERLLAPLGGGRPSTPPGLPWPPAWRTCCGALLPSARSSSGTSISSSRQIPMLVVPGAGEAFLSSANAW